MKSYLLYVLFFVLSLHAFASPAYVQSAHNWNVTSGNTCAVSFTLNTGPTNLIVVWASWTVTGTNTITASAKDTQGNGIGTPPFYPSAVGPTLQPSATNPAAGEIFYAGDTAGGADTITVTFSSAPTSSSCVIVEYSGADLTNPLDSVSAGYSIGSTNLLDSGNAAPANSNLLVFGAGFSDSTVGAIAGSGFTKHEESSGPWGTGIVEDNTSAITGNNVLQRATACLSSGLMCGPTDTGHWLMRR